MTDARDVERETVEKKFKFLNVLGYHICDCCGEPWDKGHDNECEVSWWLTLLDGLKTQHEAALREELARLQSALTQKNGEPKWSRGFRVIDGKTCEIIEGVIAKADYDALTAQHEAAVRELGLVKQNERLAIQALTEAQREIERLREDIQKHKDDRSFWAAKSHEQVLAKRTAEAQIRALREALEQEGCQAYTHPKGQPERGCRAFRGDPEQWCFACRLRALTTPPAS